MNKAVKWTSQQEQLLVTWAEKASGYAWLHTRSINYFKHRNLYISVPASVFGNIAGATTLLSNPTLAPALKGLIGMSGIMAGLLTYFQEMFTFKEEGEKHKISSLRFLSFFREISCELSTDPEHRTLPHDFITMKRLEFDKMLEQSPNIPQSIVDLFNTKFNSIAFHKPDIVNGIQTITPFRKNSPKMYYLKKINLYQKMLLLKYFSAWKTHCEATSIVRKNDALIEATNLATSMCEREKTFSTFMHPYPLKKNYCSFKI